jgi:hypothetical protein
MGLENNQLTDIGMREGELGVTVRLMMGYRGARVQSLNF